ncbi:MAG: ComEC/Rec2 family competence protein [Gemmataceae bacterium]
MASWPGPADLAEAPHPRSESVWRSPLVSVAAAFTVGLVVDRVSGVDFRFALLVAACGLLGFVVAHGKPPLALLYLAGAIAALGAALHHYHRDLCDPSDVGLLADDRPRPVRLRGVLLEEPRRLPSPPSSPLRSIPADRSAAVIVQATGLGDGAGSRPIGGRVRVLVSGPPQLGQADLLTELHAGDRVEVCGRLVAVPVPANPGEFDASAYWRDRGVRALLQVRHGDDAVVRLERGWAWSPAGWLGVARTRAHRLLDACLAGTGERTTALARALLLGEGAPMTNDDWAKYVRTGVVHVLAISGQHLVVVAFFLWTALRAVGVRQRRAAVIVAAVLAGYALLTGGRPPALRSAVGSCAVCAGLILRRPVLPGNTLALGWLTVGLLQPGDLFDTGCQLSFLSVAVLCWGTDWLTRRETDPLDRMVQGARPLWLRIVHGGFRGVYEMYAISFVIWIAILPLVVYHTGMLPTAVLLLGPPLTVLTSIALFLGFVVLALGGWAGPLAVVPAWLLAGCMAGCEWLVDRADAWPTHVHVGGLGVGWVVAFYLVLLAVLTEPALRRRWRWFAPLAPVWLCLVLVPGPARQPAGELRCTFLAVGHGGCVVLELPDGRTLLYDAGSLRGPDVATRTVAPFLWARGIRRVDEVVLSHADLDHFNALAWLAERCAIGRVLCSETFAARANAATAHTLRELDRRGVRLETVRAGDRLTAGAATLDVLHPPAGFYHGTENARSVVLRVSHYSSVLLLTGDLEGDGLASLLRRVAQRADVLQVPHHGSAAVDHAALAAWCRPRLVVSCQGPPRGLSPTPQVYTSGWGRRSGAPTTTAPSPCSTAGGLTVEGYHREVRLRE